MVNAMLKLAEAIDIFAKYDTNPTFKILHDEIIVGVDPMDVDKSDTDLLMELGFVGNLDWQHFTSQWYR